MQCIKSSSSQDFMTAHSRGYDFNKKMVFSVLMIVMIVDMVMMRDGYIMYMSVTYRPFL